jgi:hypothetical protein
VSFHLVLKRLEAAAEGRNPAATHTTVEKRDLRELLRNFHRIDDEARERYNQPIGAPTAITEIAREALAKFGSCNVDLVLKTLADAGIVLLK